MLRRSAFKPSTSTLKRSGFLRTVIKEDRAVVKARKAMKSSRPKMTPIRASAKDEQCTLRFPVCNFDPATTVWAHSNRAEDGKGTGIKARDGEGCYACFACHSFLDGGYAGKMTREMVDVYFDIARTASQKILRRKGLMQGATPSDSQSLGVADHEKL